MPKDTHQTLPVDAELVLPERLTLALAELAGAAREGLLALAVGAGRRRPLTLARAARAGVHAAPLGGRRQAGRPRARRRRVDSAGEVIPDR